MEDVEVDENGDVHDQTADDGEDERVDLDDLVGVVEDQRDGKAAHKEERREEVPRVLPAAVPVAPDVPAVAHPAQDVRHGHKQVRYHRDQRIPVVGQRAGKDVQQKAECNEPGKCDDAACCKK